MSPPSGFPPPVVREASREALCWSKTTKNEVSGPMGAKAMRASGKDELQDQEKPLRPIALAEVPPTGRRAFAPQRFLPAAGHVHNGGRKPLSGSMRRAPPIG